MKSFRLIIFIFSILFFKQLKSQVNTLDIHPNPVTDTCTLTITLISSERITISIFDINGKTVKTLIDDSTMLAGKHSVIYSTLNLQRGVYIANLKVGKQSIRRKIIKQGGSYNAIKPNRERVASYPSTRAIYPNPTTPFIRLPLVNGIMKIDFLDTSGKICKTIQTSFEVVSISEIPIGTYTVNIYSSKGVLVTSEKIVKENCIKSKTKTLKEFYNTKGRLIYDANYAIKNYDSIKPILVNEKKTLEKLLDYLDYPTLCFQHQGVVILVINFENGIAKSTEGIPLVGSFGDLLSPTCLNEIPLSLFKLKQKQTTKLYIPICYTFDFAPTDRKIPGVGEKTYGLLSGMKIEKIETVQQMPIEVMGKLLGENGQTIWKKAQGIDNSPVEPYSEQKSMSKEETFDADTIDMILLRDTIIQMVDTLAYDLRNEKKVTGCVTLKIKYSDFQTHTYACTIPYTASDHVIEQKVLELFKKNYSRRQLIRLIGVKFTKLVSGFQQIDMFSDTEERVNLYQAIDKMRKRFGIDAVLKGISAKGKVK